MVTQAAHLADTRSRPGSDQVGSVAGRTLELAITVRATTIYPEAGVENDGCPTLARTAVLALPVMSDRVA